MKVSSVIIAVLAGALVLLGVLYLSSRSDLADAHADYAALVKDTKDAQIRADADWAEAVRKKEKEYADSAIVADQRYTALRSDYAAAVLRAKAAAGRGGASRPAAVASGEGAGVPEAAAGPAELCISDADAMKVGDLAAYATAAHEWALTLESSGNK